MSMQAASTEPTAHPEISVPGTGTNRALFVLALAGAGLSVFLTLAYMGAVNLPCTVVHGCEKVAQSDWAWGFGLPFLKAIPTPAFGIPFYLAIAGLSIARIGTSTAYGARRLSRMQFILSVLGVAVSAWLTYLEAFVIHAWCQWCMASALVSLLVFLVCAVEQRAVFPRAQGDLGV